MALFPVRPRTKVRLCYFEEDFIKYTYIKLETNMEKNQDDKKDLDIERERIAVNVYDSAQNAI